MKKNTTVNKHEVFVVKTKEHGKLLMSVGEIENTEGIIDICGVTSDELYDCMKHNVRLFNNHTVLSFKVRTLIVEISFRLEE